MNWNWNCTPSWIHFVCTIRTLTLIKLLLSFSNKKNQKLKKMNSDVIEKKNKELSFAVILNKFFNLKTDIWNC